MNKEEIVQRLERVKECIKGHEQHGVPELWDEYSELKQEKKQLKKQLKELPSLEVGRWYHSKYGKWTYLLYLVSIDKGLDSCTAYGFVDGEWYSQKDINFDTDQIRATDQEVETALIKEAKKRGFKEGVSIITPKGNKVTQKCNKYHFNKHLNILATNESYTELNFDSIFIDGKWAEIIEEPKTVTLNGEYTETQLKDILNNRF